MAFWNSADSFDAGLLDTSADPAEVLGEGYDVVPSKKDSAGLTAPSADGPRFDFTADDDEQFSERRRKVLEAAAKAGLGDGKHA